MIEILKRILSESLGVPWNPEKDFLGTPKNSLSILRGIFFKIRRGILSESCKVFSQNPKEYSFRILKSFPPEFR